MGRHKKVVEVKSEVLDIIDLQAKQDEVKAKKRLLKDIETQNKWEADTKELNHSYVLGSIRASTLDDTKVLGHVHGQVCLIKCSCGVERLVNKQDAKQVRFCRDCKKGASSAKNKERRQAKKLASISKEDLEAQLKVLNEQLAKVA